MTYLLYLFSTLQAIMLKIKSWASWIPGKSSEKNFPIEKLPDEALLEILRFLPPGDKEQRFMRLVIMLSKIPDPYVRKFLSEITFQQRRSLKCTMDDMLAHNWPDKLLKLITYPFPILDRNCRYFSSISALEYAFWAQDSDTLACLLAYLRKINLVLDSTQTINIPENGIKWTFNKQAYTSNHFDMSACTQAIAVAQAYLEEHPLDKGFDIHASRFYAEYWRLPRHITKDSYPTLKTEALRVWAWMDDEDEDEDNAGDAEYVPGYIPRDPEYAKSCMQNLLLKVLQSLINQQEKTSEEIKSLITASEETLRVHGIILIDTPLSNEGGVDLHL